MHTYNLKEADFKVITVLNYFYRNISTKFSFDISDINKAARFWENYKKLFYCVDILDMALPFIVNSRQSLKLIQFKNFISIQKSKHLLLTFFRILHNKMEYCYLPDF